MKSVTFLLVAVTVFSLFLESSIVHAKSTANEISSSVNIDLKKTENGVSELLDSVKASTNKSKTGIVSNVGEKIESITKVEVDDAEKQLVNKNMDYSEEALARAKRIVAYALPNATGTAKVSITAASGWLESLQAMLDVLHPQMRDAIASGSVLALNTVLIELSAAIKLNKAILAKFDEDFPAGEVKTGVSKEIKIIKGYAIFDLNTMKKWLSN